MDYLNATISILVTGLLLGGFFAMGVLLIFELGTVFLLWIKHGYINERRAN